MKKFDIEKLNSEGKDEKIYTVPASNGLTIKVYKSGRKKFYYRRVHAPGRSKYYPIGEYPLYDLDRAREKMLQIRRSIEFGDFISRDEDITFIDVMKKAIDEHLSNKKPTTAKTFNVRCNRLVNHFRNKKLLAVTPQDIRDLYNPLERGRHLATLKRINQMMEIIYSYATKNGYISGEKNPLRSVNYAENYLKYENSNAKHHPKLITLDDLHDFFKSLASQDEAKITYVVAAIFCAATGLRIDSVVNVKWSYFNSDFSKMCYPKTKLKGERETEERREDLLLPLPPLLQEILKKYKTTINPFAAYQRSSEYVFCGLRGKISVDGLRKFVKEVSNYKITPHGLRGTLTTWSKKRLEHQVPLFYVKMYLHQQPTTDEIDKAYTEISYTDQEAQEHLSRLGKWYSEFLVSQYDFVAPVLEKLY